MGLTTSPQDRSTAMSEMPISPLRRRMIEDMTVRQFVEKTQADYIRHVRTFTVFLGRSPDTATAEDLRRFQLHQAESGVRPPSMNGAVAALRFFFGVTLERPDLGRALVFVREPRKIPVILSLEEVADVLEAAPGPKYQAALAAGRPADRRGCQPQGGRRRLPADAAADRAGERPQGPLRQAARPAPRTAP
jgi:hypothetical protein